LKIALLTDGIWPFVIGGMQRHSYYVCKFLAKNKIHVHLYHSSRNGVKPKLESCFTDEELEYIEDHYISYPSSDKLPGHYLRTSYKYSSNIYNALLNSTPVDIIYVKGLSGWRLLKENKEGKKFPIIAINVHGYEYYQRAPSFKAKMEQYMLRPAFRFVNEEADYIFSYGANISSIIRRHIRNSENKIMEIPAGIEMEMLGQQPVKVNSSRRFVFVGRFERRKGIQELLEAVTLLDTAYTFEFHFIGNIPYHVKTPSSKLTFHGEIGDKKKMKEILSDSDVLVCPSYAEGMPNVILEGMAAGCAVIATNVGAIPVMVDNNNGWLIKEGSVSALLQALVAAVTISENELLRKKQYSYNKVIKEFMWDNIISKLISSFYKMIPDLSQIRVKANI
jgi:glycosyltransferase involved in cell wall biosynthesis